jgi:hypothetical protein
LYLYTVGNDAANDVWEARRREGTVTPAAAAAAATAVAAAAEKDDAAAAAATATSSSSDAVVVESSSNDNFAGFEPEHPPPVASACSSFGEALEAISGKYVRREHVQVRLALFTLFCSQNTNR